ncbi:hypothetical protein D893_02255 [Thioalkalivibrio sp. ALE21]|uniref:hypothetical protein n=1 Tax=Thioalkalivibrio sp. ALE21 TaxID=1158175 RepID=UPI000D990BB5|nr:hypothetical protein [Thioalkalivibrio sp. ALE21]PYG00749.1 hypothetical protein D893_02255 [Thioalkalivibrio sp. ALE21]
MSEHGLTENQRHGNAAGSPAAAIASALGEAAVRAAHGDSVVRVEVSRVRGEGWASEVEVIPASGRAYSEGFALRIEIARSVMPNLCHVPLTEPDPRDWAAEVGIPNALGLEGVPGSDQRLMEEFDSVRAVLLYFAGAVLETVHKTYSGTRWHIDAPESLVALETSARKAPAGERWGRAVAEARRGFGSSAPAGSGAALPALSRAHKAEGALALMDRIGLDDQEIEQARSRGAAWREARLAAGNLSDAERAWLQKSADDLPARIIGTDVALGRARPGHEIEDVGYWWRVFWLRLMLGVDPVSRAQRAVVNGTAAASV